MRLFKSKDPVNGNLCDDCDNCIAECGGKIEFGNATAASDNVISCDSFVGPVGDAVICVDVAPEVEV
jgi:hypothetical protein